MPTTAASPEIGRARLKARIEAARRAAPIAPVSDEEFRNDVIEARKEYRELLRKGLAPAPTEPENLVVSSGRS
jgi:hypothetical protein